MTPGRESVLRATSLVGLPVVSIATGEDIAEIRDVIYDAGSHALVGFTLNKRGFLAGRLKDTLGTDQVAAIGNDAVMVSTDAAVSEAADAAEVLERPKDSAQVIGNRVVSTGGDELGEVVGVILTTGQQPSAVGYEVARVGGEGSVFVPISAQMSLSNENLILPAESTEFIRDDLAGFGAAVTEFRNRTIGSDGRTADRSDTNPTSGLAADVDQDEYQTGADR